MLCPQCEAPEMFGPCEHVRSFEAADAAQRDRIETCGGMNPDEGSRFFRGFVFAVVLALPFWALLCGLVWLVTR